jgi:pimeloyl-ACP methyl ester carboxylesterase
MQLHPDLIVFLPGITGSVLEKDGKVLWGNSLPFFYDMVTGNPLAGLTLNAPDNRDDDCGDGIVATRLVSNIQIVPRLWKLGGYSIFSEKLQSRLPLEAGKNFFEFPYDWRRDNRVSARKLATFCHDKLKIWREASNNDQAKITIVAHSMGGIIARYFIECLEGWKTTRMLISMGTPYRGSLNALDSICNGAIQKIGGVTVADGTETFRSFQSVYQLLPTYGAIDAGDGSFKKAVEVNLPNMDAARATQALAFHDEITAARTSNLKEAQYCAANAMIVPLVGMDQPTNQSAILADGALRILKSFADKDDGGDGTVPQISAIPADYDFSAASFVANTHSALPSLDATINHVRGVVSSSTIDRQKYRSLDSRPTIGIEVDYIYAARMPVTVQASVSDYRQTLTATFTDQARPAERSQATLYPKDGRYHCEIELPPGMYHVRVQGEETSSTEDVFSVVA